MIVTGADTPRLFLGPDFILNFRPSCSASRFTFPTSCLGSSLPKTCLKANWWLSPHQVRKLGAVLIGSLAFSRDQILFNTTFYGYDPVKSSSPPKSTSTMATLDTPQSSPACRRFLTEFPAASLASLRSAVTKPSQSTNFTTTSLFKTLWCLSFTSRVNTKIP